MSQGNLELQQLYDSFYSFNFSTVVDYMPHCTNTVFQKITTLSTMYISTSSQI